MKLPILVVGGDGLIGGALAKHLSEQGETPITTVLSDTKVPNSILFDLTASAWPLLPRVSAAVICAAVTSQQQCRKDPARTRHVNVVQTLKLIGELVATDTFVVFLSTNLVFDGSKPLRTLNETTCPKTEYGRQKAEVELALTEWRNKTAIIRLTKVFHSGLPLLVKWRQDLGAGRKVEAFTDYLCSPIYMQTVVSGISRITRERRSGIWHFSGPTDVSYATLARTIARLYGAKPSLVRFATASSALLEHLPANTTLDSFRTREQLNLVFPEADAVLNECLGPNNSS